MEQVMNRFAAEVGAEAEVFMSGRIDAARRRLAQAREEAAAGPAAAHVAEAITPALDVLNSNKYRKKLIDGAADAPPA
jgi:hypothetical protein